MSFMERFSLKGKKIIVTGGAQGIGRAVSEAMADCGAQIGIFDMNIELARKTAAEISERYGAKVQAFQCDVTAPQQVDQAFCAFLDSFGELDGVFNNAGICQHKEATEVSCDEWCRVVDVNLNGIFLVAQAAGRYFINAGKRGSIVNTASMSGHIVNIPQPQASYNASKAGVIQLTKSLAVEWAVKGVRVNCISPGYVGSDMVTLVRQDWQDTWLGMIPYHRYCEPQELAGAVIYLLSDASTYTSGCDLVIDGCFTNI
ncbi:SDR family oxidoreductase [Anaerotruncus colihominis]|uniref:SDR family oxidoreductase n=1 Tax=Anaerotruncus colihominis TaxID=169435 RepID=UPI000D7B0576|nr:SDR family oxidoreductase [Anaerotruncus colihominis]PWM22239.1 MAG: short-chain dehydrogenase [Collinsella tanakaei]